MPQRSAAHLTTRSPSIFYWISTGLFCLLFTGSVFLTISGPDVTIRETVFLGYPSGVIYPQAAAKALGVLTVIVKALTGGKFRTLTTFAFAGFLSTCSA